MNNEHSFGEVRQIFGAEVDDEGKVVQDGKRGFRVMEFTTELDSQGLEEGYVSILDPRYEKVKKWENLPKEIRANEEKIAKRNIAHAVTIAAVQRVGEFAQLMEKLSEIQAEMDKATAGLMKGSEEYNEEAAPFEEEMEQATNEFFSSYRDMKITDVGLHRYFVDREPSGPDVGEFEWDKPEFNRLRDEAQKEIPFIGKVKLEKENWPHLRHMEYKRQQRALRIEMRMRSIFNSGRKDRWKTNQLNLLKKIIDDARDFSFQQRALDFLMPNIRSKQQWQKRNAYLFQDVAKGMRAAGLKFNANQHLTKRERRIFWLYTESRGLTFEQHKYLQDLRIQMLEAIEKKQALVEPKKKEEHKEPIKLDMNKIDRMFQLVMRDNMREKVQYFRDLYEDAMEAKDYEMADWARQRGDYWIEQGTKYVKEHNISKDEKLPDFQPTAEG